MSVSSSRPDPASPAAVAGASFGTSRKGFDPDEVRAFLRAVSAEMTRLEQQIAALQRDLAARQEAGPSAPVTLDEDTVTALLGAETARIVQTAREAAAQIKARAEEGAAKLLRDASDEAARLRNEAELDVARKRADASADAEAEVEMARQQGRDMVNEARDYRERVLADVARRRELARAQLEQLVHGRDRLVNAFERARLAAVDVMAELVPLGAEPEDLVNLSPTTGPVPVVPAPSPTAVAADLPTVEVEVVEVDSDDEFEDVEVDEHVAASDDEDDEDDDEDDEDDDEDEDDDDEDDEDEGVTVDQHLAVVDDPPVSAPVDVDVSEPGGDLLRLPANDDEDDEYDEEDDDRPSAPVVSLFAGEIDSAPRVSPEPETSSDTSATDARRASAEGEDTRATVDDLFAKLRRASAAMVAKEAAEALAADPAEGAVLTDDSGNTDTASDADIEADDLGENRIFADRDEALVPLIVSAARKLKRVLADEQNDVLDALRRATAITRIDDLLPSEPDQAGRYLTAATDDLRAAAEVGARSLSDAGDETIARTLGAASVLGPVTDAFTADVVRPLRERLERGVMQVGDDTDELAVLVRNVYREWKTQRIDEHIEDLVRLAHGRGAFAVLTPGTPVCWRVDPNGPPCADAEDNALGGLVPAGDPFPTGHRHPPMHSGCRCLLETTPG